MKALLRSGMPLLLALAAAVIVGILGMHALALSSSTTSEARPQLQVEIADATADATAASAAPAPALPNPHGRAHADDPAHRGPDGSAPCPADGADCCSMISAASVVSPFPLHALPGPAVSAATAPVTFDLLLATAAAEHPPSRELLSVIRV